MSEAVPGEISFNPNQAHIDEVQARRDEILEKIGDKLAGPAFGLEFNVMNDVCSGIFKKISGDRIFLTDATQVEKGTNIPLGRPAKELGFNILKIDMDDSFKVISAEEVKAKNEKMANSQN